MRRFLFLVSFFFLIGPTLPAQTYLFDHYSAKEGLPSNWITSIHQDSRGYLWVGGDGGMAVYDGVSFREIGTAQGLPVPLVWSIIESRVSPGTMYAGTHGGGVGKIRDGRITTIRLGDTQSSNAVAGLMEDRNGVIWCASGVGLFRVENDSASFFPAGKDTGWIGVMHQTKEGPILLGVNRSLFWYSPADSSLTRARFGTGDPLFLSVFEDADGTLWFGTQEGLVVKVSNGRIVDRLSLGVGALPSVAGDRDGNLWFASSSGVIKVAKQNFPHGEVVRFSTENGLSGNDINVCFVDREDNLWVGSRSKGLSKLSNRNILKFRIENFLHEILNKAVAVDPSGHLFVPVQDRVWEFWKSSNGVWQRHPHNFPSVMRESGKGLDLRGGFGVDIAPDGTLWVASEWGGLRNYRIRSRPGQHSILEPLRTLRPGAELPKGSPLGITITRNNQLWYNIRTGPLVQVDLPTARVVETYEIGGEITGGTAQSICELPNGDLWIARFNGGVFVLTPDGSTYKHLQTFTEKDGLVNDRVRSIVRRRNGDLWIGTRFNGISIYRDGAFHTLGSEHGLQNNAIWRMVEDEEGRMWIGTSIGVQYTEPDGNILLRQPGLSGEQIIGIGLIPGRKTIWTITSEHLTLFEYGHERGPIIPPLVSIAGLRINGIDRGLDDGQSFSHSENFCVIRFSGISFKDPEGLQFRYRLIGLDTAWQEPTSQRTVAFGSLKPGAYTFQVQAMTTDGTQSDTPATLAFTILPPWYLSPWTIGLYILFGSLLVFFYTKVRTRQLERRSIELERVVAERTAELIEHRNLLHNQAERLRELDVMKSHFFTNISHEFRTPLTVILGHLQRLRERMTATEGNDVDVMDRNARRLLHLINQLLDLSKIEAGGMTLRASRSDVAAFTRRVAALLSSYAEHKGISLTVNRMPLPATDGQSPIFIYFDQDKIEKVLYNLLSNALKFTARGGAVDISLASGELDNGQEMVEIAVSDTGLGIPAAMIPFVFDRFYQVEDYTHPGYEGTGIGLALVKELVDLHHGKVTVTSTVGKGTTFTVRLPMGMDHFDEGEVVEESDAATPSEIHALPDVDDVIRQGPAGTSPDDTTVLIVEDNADLRRLIISQLEEDYVVVEAANGNDGVRMAEEHVPDLVISDIMMPGMDGYQVCRTIKTEEKTSHIPVILLTAKATTEHKLEGLETGADDYLTKPFNPQELKLRVRNLIQLRKQLREKFSSEMLLKPTEVSVPSMQKVFLEKVTSTIEKHLADEEFSVESLAAEVGMSRAQLHRKLKALTNKAPNELIRSFRLQRAAALIRQDAGSLAEIAYQVGFSSQAYFTRCFVEEFGMTPTDYKKTANAP